MKCEHNDSQIWLWWLLWLLPGVPRSGVFVCINREENMHKMLLDSIMGTCLLGITRAPNLVFRSNVVREPDPCPALLHFLCCKQWKVGWVPGNKTRLVLHVE